MLEVAAYKSSLIQTLINLSIFVITQPKLMQAAPFAEGSRNIEDDKDNIDIHFVHSAESPEFTKFKWAISHSSIIGLDAEWKPVRSHQPNTFPPVLLLQIACQLINSDEQQVFLLDLSQIHLPSIYDLLKDVFISPDILKLGFLFKQDLLYLSSTFRDHGCDSGFHAVVPYLDIANIYLLVHHQPQLNQTRRKPKCNKSLSSICHDLLGFSLSKELQCSDWSVRPLTHQQKTYAALDALCLIHIFNLFLQRLLNQGSFRNLAKLDDSSFNLGLKQILSENDTSTRILRITYPEAVEMVRATIIEYPQKLHAKLRTSFKKLSSNSMPMDDTLLQVVREYGDKIELTELDGKPRSSKTKGKRKSKERRVEYNYIYAWQGPAPWDSLLGGDGCPKFLCDMMVTGLAKHLRCVGVDAAVPYSKKPESRELIDQAIKEKRVLLTRDGHPLRQEYLLKNQIYRLKSELKFDQLSEVIETFQLNICEYQLMSRCCKCNARFIRKSLSIEEAIEAEAAKGVHVIPKAVFDQNIKIWQCTDCNHIYWEGTKHLMVVQRYIDVCKISSTA